MTKYAKLVCGSLQVPQNYPNHIVVDGRTIESPTEEQYKAAGYLPLQESEPEEREGKVAIATYAVNKKGTAIVQSWQYIDEPEERVEDGVAEEPIEETNKE